LHCHLSDHAIDFCVVEFRAVGGEFESHNVHPRMLGISVQGVYVKSFYALAQC
jgi:hypothetical protein